MPRPQWALDSRTRAGVSLFTLIVDASLLLFGFEAALRGTYFGSLMEQPLSDPSEQHMRHSGH